MKSSFKLILSFFLFSVSSVFAQNQDISVSFHLRGVYESRVGIIPLSGTKPSNSIAEVPNVQGGYATLEISKDFLPGEFLLRFEYRKDKENNPAVSEKRIVINKQNLELWVNPAFINNPDSTWFQNGETENTAYESFVKENIWRIGDMQVLRDFMMNYTETESELFNLAAKEYEKRRNSFNQWLELQTIKDSALYVSSIYGFSFVPEINWKGTNAEREQSVLDHYFDGINFQDQNIIRTAEITEWMNNYVNLHMKLITKMSVRDSILSKAARTAIEKSKQGSPLVYGWMVDYFYKGFEANNIPEGMKVLEPYLADPNCMTSKRMEINRRLEGMEKLIPGILAPKIVMAEPSGNLFTLSNYNPDTEYILLLFWSADCNHCVETVTSLYPWQQMSENKEKISVLAISLDETDTEIAAWQNKINELSGWKHLRANDGIRSKVAEDYFILATPVMILLDSKTKEIVSLPTSSQNVESYVKQ